MRDTRFHVWWLSALFAGMAGRPGVAVGEPGPVGALVDDEQRVVCSGTLISPDTLLTAAHCVARGGVVRWPWGFFLGEDVRLGGEFVRVVDGAVHPEYDEFLHGADLAVLRIAGGGVRPAFVDLHGGVPAVGGSVRIVGFGSGSVGADARVATVVEASAGAFRYEPGSCPGDSGGAVLVSGAGVVTDRAGSDPDDPDDEDEDDPDEDEDEDDPDDDDEDVSDGEDDSDDAAPTIAGVISTGSVGCGSARAIATAAHIAWISDAVAYLDPIECRADGVCGESCTVGDADCPCVEDGDCRLCDGVDLDCSGSCDSDGTCVTACLAPDPDCRVLEEGASCSADIECASSVCVDQVCREPCAAGAGCPPWAACMPGGATDVCVPYSNASVLGGCAAGERGAGWLAVAILLLVARTAPGLGRSRVRSAGARSPTRG